MLTSTTFKNDEMLYIFQGKNIGKIQLGAVIALFLTVIKLHCRLLAYECVSMYYLVRFFVLFIEIHM